ncbi:MAG: hypothetical protein RMM08_02245 [Armatimonadota bacterium]|nr:hypothetical protein [Armatimonadota bacterium]
MLRKGSSLVLLLMMCLTVGAEPVALPPLWTESFWVQHLTSLPVTNGERLETGYHLFARTNVRPLLQSGQSLQPFARGYGYYRFASLSEIRLHLSRWRVSYAFGVADHFEGDGGAVHLYLGGLNLAQLPTSDADVTATLNRSAVNRWTVEHLLPLQCKHGEGWLLLAGSLYLSRRIQQGALSGRWHNAQFDGDLLLDTTRGLDAGDTRSTGWGLHLALSVPLSARWRVSFWGENLLGQIRQRKLQRITARVQANTIVPDADGFLHAAPFLSGRVDYLSRNLSLQPQLAVAAAYHQGKGAWLLRASWDADEEWIAGYASADYRLLFALPRGEWSMAYHTGQWTLVAGFSSVNPVQAKHATLSLRYTIPLASTRSQ